MTRFGTAREGWCAAICVILILAVGVGGGTSIDNGWRLLLFMGLTLAALLVAPRPERTFADLPLLFRIAIALTLILPAIQLIPLPPSIWQALPGRETEIAVLKLVGGADGWRPVTVDVFATLQSWFAIILAAAVGWLAWSGSARLFDTMRYAIFAIVLAATFFGYTQYLAAGAGYYLYDQGYHDDAVGFFSNRNHFGTMMAAVMPVRSEEHTSELQSH